MDDAKRPSRDKSGRREGTNEIFAWRHTAAAGQDEEHGDQHQERLRLAGSDVSGEGEALVAITSFCHRAARRTALLADPGTIVGPNGLRKSMRKDVGLP